MSLHIYTCKHTGELKVRGSHVCDSTQRLEYDNLKLQKEIEALGEKNAALGEKNAALGEKNATLECVNLDLENSLCEKKR